LTQWVTCTGGLQVTCWLAAAQSEKKTCEGCVMKNPLDSLGQTIILGFVLTVIVAVLIPLFGA
jgi:hypothetical protein